MLQDWITPRYLRPATIPQLARKFSQNKPFPHLELKNFFHPSKIILLEKALRQEPSEFKQADLFQFSQTKDLIGAKSKILQEFRTFLVSPEFLTYMNKLTSCKLKSRSIDIAGTRYADTDFLLCHDDRLENRRIAFFLYLTDLNVKDGGRLQFYSSRNQKPQKITKTILPKRNTFAFFKVSSSSFHSVEEVMTTPERLAISGWFHDQ